jgi:phosphonate C-P lyase system protein PhnK
MMKPDQPLLIAQELSKWYGRQLGCRDVSFSLHPGEVVAVVGESGSGKSTLLQLLSCQLAPSRGRVLYAMRDGETRDLAALGEAERRFLFRTDWGYVHQDPALGLRMSVSAGANVGERLMALGWRHYGRIRTTAGDWLARVEIDQGRIDDAPLTYSGGMRQRLQIARNLVTRPRLVFMDEPTGGLVGAGAPARSHAHPRHRAFARGGGRDPRPRRRTAVIPSHYRDEERRGDRDRIDRPGVGGSARSLYAAARILGPAAVRSPACRPRSR